MKRIKVTFNVYHLIRMAIGSILLGLLGVAVIGWFYLTVSVSMWFILALPLLCFAVVSMDLVLELVDEAIDRVFYAVLSSEK